MTANKGFPGQHKAVLWWTAYNRKLAMADAVAALIVTLMLIPQSLAYAQLAGLPPQVGLYASMLPLVAYALLGSSMVIAVGPVAVISLMTATAVSAIAAPGSPEYLAGVLILAALSGLILLLMGLLKLGWLANLLSHPVITGFIAASALLITFSQLPHLLGLSGHGNTLPSMIASLLEQWHPPHLATSLIGLGGLVFLLWARGPLQRTLPGLGMSQQSTDILSKTAPVFAVVASTALVASLKLDVAVVGSIPDVLPAITLPPLNSDIWLHMLPAAAMISLIGFVESVSVAQTLAAKRRQRIQPNRELLGLGAANLAAAVSGGYPVTGGFARSVVNFDAGAQTPMAGIFTAAGIALATLWLTPLLYFLPKATLAATIIVAVLNLIKMNELRQVWRYSKPDFAAMVVTMAGVLLAGVEAGVVAGVLCSLVLLLWQSSRPHVAVVGLVPGTEHFRNQLRHQVICSPKVLSVRVDESLHFANTRRLEDSLYEQAVHHPQIKDAVLMCSAINHIDASALESLLSLNQRLKDAGVRLHLSEVKGPVMDQLKRSELLHELSGKVFMSQYEALCELDPELPLRESPDESQPLTAINRSV